MVIGQSGEVLRGVFPRMGRVESHCENSRPFYFIRDLATTAGSIIRLTMTRKRYGLLAIGLLTGILMSPLAKVGAD